MANNTQSKENMITALQAAATAAMTSMYQAQNLTAQYYANQFYPGGTNAITQEEMDAMDGGAGAGITPAQAASIADFLTQYPIWINNGVPTQADWKTTLDIGRKNG